MKNIILPEEIPPSKNKIIYFYLPETNYHQKFNKMLQSLEKETEIEVISINARSEDSLYKRFNFISVPCLIYYKNNKEFKRHEGMISFKELKKLFRLTTN